MLLDLEILNGRMSLDFDKYVNEYTVFVDENTERLELNYKVNDGYRVDIINNENIIDGMNLVYVIVTGDNIQNTYTLEVYKNKVKEVIKVDDTSSNIEVKSEVSPSVTYMLIIGCIIIILFFFIIIFHPLKRKSYYSQTK